MFFPLLVISVSYLAKLAIRSSLLIIKIVCRLAINPLGYCSIRRLLKNVSTSRERSRCIPYARTVLSRIAKHSGKIVRHRSGLNYICQNYLPDHVPKYLARACVFHVVFFIASYLRRDLRWGLLVVFSYLIVPGWISPGREGEFPPGPNGNSPGQESV